MPHQLQKSLQDYLSKIKKHPPQFHLPSRTLSSSTSWILRGCRHPKTPSISLDHKENDTQNGDEAATLSDIDRFLLENFKSLYKKEDDDDEDREKDGSSHEVINNEEKSGGVLFDQSPRFMNPPENLYSSHRFFAALGSSSSLMEEARTSLTLTSASTSEDTGSSTNCTTTTTASTSSTITVLKYSPNPYDDFRTSMHEMMEAQMHNTGKIDWEFMEELLFCYLNLNDKKSYRFILRAFVDLNVVLRENSGRVPEMPRNVGSNGGSSRRRRMNNQEM